MEDILTYQLYGNTAQAYLFALGVFLGAAILLKLTSIIAITRLEKMAEKTSTTLDDFIVHALKKTIVPLLYIGALYLAIKTLDIPIQVTKYLGIAYGIICTIYIVREINSVIRYSLSSYIRKKDKGNSEMRLKQLNGMQALLSVLTWGVAIVFLLDNLGLDVATIIAGLGVGGIAIAIAAQAILGDLFSYFVIFFDRPFEIGDFVIVDDKLGAIEYIGIKSTRIRSLTGEQLVFSNTDLTNSRIHNYKKMERRRVLFSLGVTYQTTPEHLKAVPDIVKEIIDDEELATYDRGHFSSFGDFSLGFEFVYYINSANYTQYMNTQQSVYLKIYSTFAEKGIEFAYPTQTVFVNKEGS